MAINSQKLLDAKTTTGAGDYEPISGSKKTLHLVGSTSAGSGAAVVTVQVSNDNQHWITAGVISLTLDSTGVSDGFAMEAPWKYIRGYVTSISGTDASLDLYCATEEE